MNKKSGTSKASANRLVKTIRRKTRQTYSAEEKIRIVLAGLRGEESIGVTQPKQRNRDRRSALGRVHRTHSVFDSVHHG
jgi:hypothetical protein